MAIVKMYVASSWRNQYYPEVLKCFWEAGFVAYDFHNHPHVLGGFHWRNIDSDFPKRMTKQYRECLKSPWSDTQFKSNLDALT